MSIIVTAVDILVIDIHFLDGRRGPQEFVGYETMHIVIRDAQKKNSSITVWTKITEWDFAIAALDPPMGAHLPCAERLDATLKDIVAKSKP